MSSLIKAHCLTDTFTEDHLSHFNSHLIKHGKTATQTKEWWEKWEDCYELCLATPQIQIDEHLADLIGDGVTTIDDDFINKVKQLTARQYSIGRASEVLEWLVRNQGSQVFVIHW